MHSGKGAAHIDVYATQWRGVHTVGGDLGVGDGVIVEDGGEVGVGGGSGEEELLGTGGGDEVGGAELRRYRERAGVTGWITE
jgi:hypothetical protein